MVIVEAQTEFQLNNLQTTTDFLSYTTRNLTLSVVIKFYSSSHLRLVALTDIIMWRHTGGTIGLVLGTDLRYHTAAQLVQLG